MECTNVEGNVSIRILSELLMDGFMYFYIFFSTNSIVQATTFPLKTYSRFSSSITTWTNTPKFPSHAWMNQARDRPESLTSALYWPLSIGEEGNESDEGSL